MAQTYRDLVAWQKAMELVTEVYRVTQRFPTEEMYGLTAQVRRAAVSVPSNIAEGQARYSHLDFQRFLRQARGSLVEVETQILIAVNLGFMDGKDAKPILTRAGEVGRIVNALLNSIRKRTTEN